MDVGFSVRSVTAFAAAGLAALLVTGCAKKNDVASNATPAASAQAATPGELASAGGGEASATPAAAATSAGSDFASPVPTAGADTGLPLYPGATQSTSISGPDNGAAVVAVTNDSFDKVYAWYQSQIPQNWTRAKSDTSDGSVATFQLEQGATTKSIMLAGGKDKTTITLASTTSK
jgi:hypothetical protein